jgi:hypothetical protein
MCFKLVESENPTSKKHGLFYVLYLLYCLKE